MYIFFLATTIAFIVYSFTKVITFFFGAPYVQSSDEKIKTIIKLLDPKPGEKIVDLGSGNGKLLFEIAKKGATAYGYEINPFLVLLTNYQARKMGLEEKVKISWVDYWQKDLSEFDAVTLYGITYIMARLEKKLDEELKPGTRVISNFFKFPNWKEVKTDGVIRLYKKN